jgi:anti-sigma B factor antagonist
LRIEWSGSALVVAGELDMATCRLLDDAIREYAENGRIAMDFEGVTFVDSSGIRCLVQAHRDGIDVVVRNPVERVVYVFKVSGVADLITIEDDD